MSWNANDNKLYRGPIDRAFVSLTEPYERDYFIDEWLRTRNFAVDDANRNVVSAVIGQYNGRAPILRTDLEAFLDGRITRK